MIGAIIKRMKKAFAQKKPEFGELSRSGDDIWGVYSGLPRYNPDDLVGKRGLDIYQKMEQRDGQVKAVFMLKKHARLATPWSIVAQDNEDEEAVRQRDFIEYCFENMDGSVNSFLLKIWNAMRDGYAVAEINYRKIEDGDFAGMIGLKNLKVRKAKYYSFDTDEHGNLKPEGLVEGSTKKLPVDKFVIFSYNPSDDDGTSIYGQSDFRAAYRYYFSNDMIQRFWNIYLEKFGMPTVVGDIPMSLFEEKKDDFLDILKKIQTDTAIVKPEELKASFLEAMRRGNGNYKEAMEFNNNMIARSLLVGTLLMDTGERGSWALSKTHFDIFIYVLKYLGEETEETLMKEQIIKRLIDLNFPNPRYPSFQFDDIIKEDQESKAKIAKMLVEAGLINPEEDWVRDFLNIPAKEEGVILPPPQTKGSSLTQKFAQRRQPNRYEKKVNFTRIEKTLNDFEEKAKEDLIPILKKMRDKLKKDIQKKQILEKNLASQIERLQLSYVGELRDTIKKYLQDVYQYGRQEVQSELKKKGYVIGLPPEKALQYLNNKSFWIAGVVRDDVLKDAKAILYEGLKAGKTNSDIMFELDELFKEYTGTDALEIKSGKELTPYHLETVVRTNFTDAYNQGRWQEMMDPDVGDFVPAVEYSAILDDRTTPFCMEMDGKVFLKNDPDVATIIPPNHFNCFPAGTRVITYKNKGRSRTSKDIKNVKVGDIVLTQNDELHSVVRKFEREYEGELIVIELEDGRKIKVTLNHPIWTINRGWVRAENLRETDKLQEVPSKAYFKKPQYLKEKERLYDLYINQRKTLREIATIYGVYFSTVNRWLRRLGIPMRHGSEAVKVQWENNFERRRKISQLFEQYRNNPNFIHPWKGKKRPDIAQRMRENNPMYIPEIREKAGRNHRLSGKSKGRNNPMFGVSPPHGRGEWYVCSGGKKIFLRSSWEVKVAEYFTEQGLTWFYEAERFYLGDETYTPDFKVVNEDGTYYFVEVKGWFHEKHKRKVQLFRELYPDIPLVVWDRQCMKLARLA